MSRYTGGCLCGAVRIAVDAEPWRVGLCHCMDCRKRQGSLFHAFAVFPSSAVTVTGETRTYKTRRFCPTCGSPLFDDFGAENELELLIGCLDAPDQLMPTYEAWTLRRERWLPEFPVVHRYERDRTTTGHQDS